METSNTNTIELKVKSLVGQFKDEYDRIDKEITAIMPTISNYSNDVNDIVPVVVTFFQRGVKFQTISKKVNGISDLVEVDQEYETIISEDGKTRTVRPIEGSGKKVWKARRQKEGQKEVDVNKVYAFPFTAPKNEDYRFKLGLALNELKEKFELNSKLFVSGLPIHVALRHGNSVLCTTAIQDVNLKPCNLNDKEKFTGFCKQANTILKYSAKKAVTKDIPTDILNTLGLTVKPAIEDKAAE